MRARFRVEGIDEMDDRLGRMAEVVDDRSRIAPMLRDALEPVVVEARGIVPVQTGRLRDDITTADRAEDERLATGIVAYVGPSTDAFYAVDVEMGRPASISRSGREHGATRPHPFMRPAWDAQSDAILPRLAEGLRRLLKDEAEG